MNRPVKEIDWSLYVGKFREELLKRCHCSAAWLKACVTKVTTGEGDKASIDLSNYPPGGSKGTGMVHCPECKRWSPRDVMDPLSTKTCVDCLVETIINEFVRRLQSINDSTLAAELDYLRGQYVPNSRQIEQFGHYYSDSWESDCPNSGREEVEYRVVGLDFYDGYARHHRWVGKDTAPAMHSREDNYFDCMNENFFSRRCLGCQTVLLSEDERGLKEEIAYYKKKASCVLGRLKKIMSIHIKSLIINTKSIRLSTKTVDS